MRAILLALIWCVGLAETVTTRSDGDDNRAGQMLQTELEAGDLAAAAAEQETTQQLLSYADMYPEGSELRCALAYAAKPAGPHGRHSKGCQVALSQNRYALLVKATASIDALCTRYGREQAVVDSLAGQAGVGSAKCYIACRHRISAGHDGKRLHPGPRRRRQLPERRRAAAAEAMADQGPVRQRRLGRARLHGLEVGHRPVQGPDQAPQRALGEERSQRGA